MNNKGFTLIELLIVISISALVLIMAIPSINNTSSELKDKEYQEYKNSLIYGAKLYYKQKSADLSWTTESGKQTASVSFKVLKENGYVKKFSSTQHNSKKKCNTDTNNDDLVSVKITKENNNKITYEVKGLQCGINGLKDIS